MLIKESIKELANVEVDAFEGLTIEYAKKHNAEVLIRGLRAVSVLNMKCSFLKQIALFAKILKPFSLSQNLNIILYPQAQ